MEGGDDECSLTCFPIITIVAPNVFILGIQTMNLNIGHTIVHVNYQTTWS